MASEHRGEPTRPPLSSGVVGSALGVVAVVLAVIALIGSFVVPGPAGVPGQPGTAGSTGPEGPRGPTGTNGVNCWDLNGNGVADPATGDRNGSLAVTVLDCSGGLGAAGPSRPQGLVRRSVARRRLDDPVA